MTAGVGQAFSLSPVPLQNSHDVARDRRLTGYVAVSKLTPHKRPEKPDVATA
jgi:hypothetical protein